MIARRARVSDLAQVRDATLLGLSHATDGARIFGGVHRDSLFQDNVVITGGISDRSTYTGSVLVTGTPFIEESLIACKSVSGRARVHQSQLFDAVEIADDAEARNVTLGGNACVYGNARLEGPWTDLESFARIHEGTWTRPPHYVDLGFTVVTECVEGRILIGCRCRSLDYWKQHGTHFAQRMGWTDKQITEALSALDALTSDN